MTNIVSITVKTDDQTAAGLASAVTGSRKAGASAGQGFASEFDKGVRSVNTDLDKLSRKQATPGVSVQGVPATEEQLAAVGKKLDDLKTARATVSVSADDKTAVAALARVDARLAALDEKTAKPNITVRGAATSEADIAGVDVALDKLSKKDATPKISTGGLAKDVAGAVEQGASDGGSKLPGILGAAADNPVVATGVVAGIGLAAPFIGQIIGGAVVAGFGAGLAGIAIAGAAQTKPVERAFATLKTDANADLKAIGTPFVPVMTGILKTATSTLGQMTHVFTQAAGTIAKPFEQLGTTLVKSFAQPAVKSSINAVADSFGKLLKAVTPTLPGDIAGIANAITKMAQSVGQDPQAFSNFVTFLAGTARDSIDAVNGLTKTAEKISEVTHNVTTLNGIAPKDPSHSPFRFLTNQSIIDGLKKVNDFLPNLLQKEADGLTKVGNSGGKAADATKKLTDHTNDLIHPLKDVGDGLGVLAQNAGSSIQPVSQAQAKLHNYSETATQAASETKALNNAWNTLVGNFAGEQQSIIQADQAVKQYGKDVKTSGGNSDTAKASFYSAAQGIEAMYEAMTKSHAPASTMYKDLQQRIQALKDEGIYNKAERQEYDNLVTASNKVAYSLQGMTKAQKAAASQAENEFIPDLKKMGADSDKTRGDVDNLTNSIVNTGRKSDATKSARAQLISDLEAAGVKANTAKGFVNNLETVIARLKGKTVNVEVKTPHKFIFAEKSGGTDNPIGELDVNQSAKGSRVPGYGGGDRHLYLLEGGEAVVSKETTAKHAGDLAAWGVPGFSGGGVAGLDDMPGRIGNAYGQDAGHALLADVNAALKADIAKAKAVNAAAGVAGVPGNVKSYAPDIKIALQQTGEPAGDVGAVEHRITLESGGNPTIVNKTDRNWAAGTPSVGLMQVIGPTFASWAGPYRNRGPFEYGVSVNPLANIYAGINYAKHQYSKSLYDVMMQPGGYQAGGMIPGGGGVALVGEHGRELVHLPGGSRVYPNDATQGILNSAGGGGRIQLEISAGGNSDFEQMFLTMIRKFVRVKGGGSVQTAFGRG